MRAVNLLPGERTRASIGTPQPAALAGAVAGVLVVAIIGGGNVLQSSRVASAQKALNAAKIQLAATPLPPAAPKVTPPPPAVAEQMQPRMQAVSSALATRIAWDRILREFSLVLPSDIQLSSLSLSTPTGSNSSTSGLTLQGMTFSYDDVALLLSRMQLIPDLQNVTLGTTSVTQNVVDFTVNAGVKGAPAPVAPTLPAPTDTTTDGATS
jgi:Tfp pilus assembly protein PilN